MEPLVSVVIPTYNAERYLEENIQSLLEQTYTNIELIYVNDGSLDMSEDILERHRINDKRIRIIKQKNSGAASARNNGIRNAKGKYILILDADDFFDVNMIKMSVKRAEEQNADIVIFNGYRFDQITGEYSDLPGAINRNVMPERENFNAKDCQDDIFQITGYWVWNKLYRLEYIREHDILFQEIPLIDDAFFNVCALALAKIITVLDKQLVFYRMNNSSSKSFSYKRRAQYLYEAHRYIMEEFKKRGIYDDYRISIYKGAINHYKFMLNRIEEYELYAQAFDSIKEYLQELNAFETVKTSEKLKNYSDFMESVEEYSAAQFLFADYRNKRKYLPRFVFPYELVNISSHVVLYGAGAVGHYFYAQNMVKNYCKIVAWLDKNFQNFDKNLGIKAPDCIVGIKYDYVLIAIETEEIANKIKMWLLGQGVEEKKILWKRPNIE